MLGRLEDTDIEDNFWIEKLMRDKWEGGKVGEDTL